MHDSIRLALSAAGIAAATLFASGAPLPLIGSASHAALAPPAAVSPRLAPRTTVLDTHAAPARAQPLHDLRAPLKRAADAERTTA